MAGSDPASDPLIGRSLSHFRIDAKLGEGGMGVVYRATDERLRREVALKVLPDALASDPERRRRFLREARAAAAVSHPNIATVHDIGEAEGHAFIAMELVAGETLRVRMEPGLTHVEALRIAREIAKGLAEAHERGIVHRDLKPENVMITRGGGVKILDFGLAKVLDAEAGASGTDATASQTAEGRVMGTPPYMSPEQADGAGEIDARSDVFSFGTMLYEMLSGVRPFLGDTRIAVLYAVLHREPEPLAGDVPAAVAAVVARCLKKKREERFVSGGELSAALEGEAGVAPVMDAPSGKASAAGRVSTVSGMGTALGATLAADTTKATSEPRSAGGAAPERRGWVSGGIAAVVLAGGLLAALAWWGPRRARVAAAPAGSASSVAAASGEISRSSNAEAQRYFEAAMRSIHADSPPAFSLLKSAVNADPSFGGAYLRLWWLTRDGGSLVPTSEHADEDYMRVLALRDALSPRDRDLFDCLDAQAGATRQTRLDAYLARYPDDDVAWSARFDLFDSSEAVTDRALAANPTLAVAMANKAFALREQQRFAEALRLVAACLDISPGSLNCAWENAVDVDLQGEDCAAAESGFRRVLELAPSSREAHGLLAGALAARGASLDAVREALGTETVAGSDSPEVAEARVPMLAGDFTEVERVAKDALARVPATATEAEHFMPARTLRDAYAEAGDPASAGAVAADYLSRRPAWTAPRQKGVGGMVWAAVRGGRMSRADGERTQDASFRQLVGATESPRTPAHAWAVTYGDVQTRPEALAALAKLDALRIVRPSELSGALLFLAGRGEEARATLEKDVRPCSSILRDNTRPWARTHLFLGELDEQKGDKASACGHFAKILERWGHAKPRSVTADEARAHAKGLGCNSVATR